MVQESLTPQAVEALLRRSETARRRLHYDVANLRHQLDVPARVKSSLQSHPSAWLGGSLVAGLLASFALRGRKPKPAAEEKVRKAGITGLLLATGGALVRPMVKSLVTNFLRKKLADHLDSRASAR